jgi:hypothetical protein
MAKALFHKNQRVFVKPVGTYAVIEKVCPQWVKGVDEPIRVFYDVGLGRDFAANELTAEDTKKQPGNDEDDVGTELWRLIRARNKWQAEGAARHHPFPGTFPVVVTDEHDWGGWRVPGAEYDRYPERIEYQARLIASAPQLLRSIKTLAELASTQGAELPAPMVKLARECVAILRYVYDIPENGMAQAAE